jgi:hypothetical protein
VGAVPPRPTTTGDGLLAVTLDAITVIGLLPERPVMHLDAGYDYQPCRQILAERGMDGAIAARGVPAPIQTGRRWVIERAHTWGNQYGKLRWCTERRRLVVAFWLALASAAIVCGRLVRRAWTHYRWQDRPAAAPDYLLAQALSQRERRLPPPRRGLQLDAVDPLHPPEAAPAGGDQAERVANSRSRSPTGNRVL